MNITLDLLADRLASVLNGTGLILGQEYDLTTYTAMRARGDLNVNQSYCSVI